MAASKGRKIGRNKEWCKAYRLQRRHEKSHINRLARHLAAHPNDQTAVAALKIYRGQNA